MYEYTDFQELAIQRRVFYFFCYARYREKSTVK